MPDESGLAVMRNDPRPTALGGAGFCVSESPIGEFRDAVWITENRFTYYYNNRSLLIIN